MRKTIAFTLVLALLLPIAAFWGWLVLSPKPPLLDGVPFSPLVLDRDGNLLRLGLSEDEKYRVRIRLNEVAPEMVRVFLTISPGKTNCFLAMTRPSRLDPPAVTLWLGPVVSVRALSRAVFFDLFKS